MAKKEKVSYKMTPEAVAAVEEIIRTAERYKSCYFWKMTLNAAGRRREEFDNDYVIQSGPDEIEVNQYLNISARWFYFGTVVHKNGDRTNLTVLKTALRRHHSEVAIQNAMCKTTETAAAEIVETAEQE